jgi:hypothetical protein
VPPRCRLALRRSDLDTDNCLVQLREKGSTVRWQPISPALAVSLADHATSRGALLPTDQLLRYRDGHALTSRRYDHLWFRIGQRLPWVAAQGISIHWLRHTTLTWVERHFGYGIARAYAGHTDSTGPATTTYIKADLHAVATALSALSGQPPADPTTSGDRHCQRRLGPLLERPGEQRRDHAQRRCCDRRCDRRSARARPFTLSIMAATGGAVRLSTPGRTSKSRWGPPRPDHPALDLDHQRTGADTCSAG